MRLRSKNLKLWAWSKYSRLLAKEHRLRYLFWESTLACNLDCLHCGSDCFRGTDTSAELSKDEAVEVFRSIAEYVPARSVMVGVTGGEPLVRKDLFDVMASASRMGFPWGMVTNGYGLTRSVAQEMKASGMRTIAVSIDGPEDVHNWLRDNGQSFERAYRGVEYLRDAAFLRCLQVTTTVSPRCIPRLEETSAMVRKLRADEWRLVVIFPGGRALKNADVRLGPSDYKTLYDFIKAKRRAGAVPRVTLDEEGFLGCDYEGEVRPYWYQCRAGVQIGGVLANGDVSACPSIPRVMVQGNIRETPFPVIWEQSFQKFRDRSWMRQGPCKGCEHFGICEGNSLHLWDFDRNEPRVCHMAMLDEARRMGVESLPTAAQAGGAK